MLLMTLTRAWCRCLGMYSSRFLLTIAYHHPASTAGRL